MIASQAFSVNSSGLRVGLPPPVAPEVCIEGGRFLELDVEQGLHPAAIEGAVCRTTARPAANDPLTCPTRPPELTNPVTLQTVHSSATERQALRCFPIFGGCAVVYLFDLAIWL